MRRILVTGGEGQVGGELVRRAWPDDVEITAPKRAELDLTDASAIGAYVAAGGFAAIVNPAAYTAVDKAESEVAQAFAVNALAPAALADAARAADIPLVHVSTDYVFRGDASAPYETDAEIDPIGIYGASKAAGEFAVRLGHKRSVIVRTAWVVSARRANFVKTMLRYGAERDLMRVVADQHGAPTFAADLAEALATITLRMIDDAQAPAGVFHFSNAGATTWHGFAQAIFEAAAARGAKTPATLEAIATADFPTPARRPAYSVLSTRRLEDAYGIAPRPWRDGLPALVADIMEQAQ
ncbi:dTDP-4-dehydrorhamnose reductase [Chenggangzhangella methanolivorans]|uniref:dTDP-4-dehydrorhamnose reductase n=1 Tax=Chenggangzhangella methanolivorans TaxID=1437009 RepID=UPI00361F663F